MSIPVHCKQCGYRGIAHSIWITSSHNITFEGGSENCPECGGRAEFQSGTYDFVGDVLTAFRAPGTTRKKVEEFAGIVSLAAEGKISAEAAVEQARGVSVAFGGLLKAAHDRGITFDRVLAFILAIHAFWIAHSSDADVQAALAESRNQTELSQQMLSELEEMNASLPEPATKQETQQPDQVKMSAEKNRRTAAMKATLNGGTSLSTPPS